MRIKKLQKVIKNKNLDCIILTTSRDVEYNNNIFYYTGYKGYGVLIVKQNSSKLLVPEMEYLKAKRTGFPCLKIKKGEKEEIIKKTIGDSNNIGIDEINTSIASFKAIKKLVKTKNKIVKFKDIFEDLLNIRSVKDEYEINLIKNACKITDELFLKIIKNFKFKTEKELANFIDLEIRKKGLVPSFSPIVASGKNSSIVHHNNDGKIKKGFLLLDFGVKYQGYCSDMSRTIYIGTPSRFEIQQYYKLLKIQQDCINLCTPGFLCGDIDKYARDNLGKNFTHGLGHGVGLDVHEFPNNLPNSKDILTLGNIITVEPGVYFNERFGIRIEDCILIKKDKTEILTKSTKELINI